MNLVELKAELSRKSEGKLKALEARITKLESGYAGLKDLPRTKADKHDHPYLLISKWNENVSTIVKRFEALEGRVK